MDKMRLWKILKSFQKLDLTPDENLVILANNILVVYDVMRREAQLTNQSKGL